MVARVTPTEAHLLVVLWSYHEVAGSSPASCFRYDFLVLL